MVREFVKKEVAPLATEIDEEERFPIDIIEKMKPVGFFGITMPKEYGGAGGDNLLYTMAIEELSRGCPAIGIMLSVHTSLGIDAIYMFGTPEQKAKYIPRMVTGEWLGDFCINRS